MGEMAHPCCPVFSQPRVLQQQQGAVVGRVDAGLGWAAPTAPQGRAQLIVVIPSPASFGSVCSRDHVAFLLMRQKETNCGGGLSAGKWQSPR